MHAQAVTPATARAKAYAWLIQQQKGDGSWVDSSGHQLVPTSIAVQAMSISGITYGYVTGAGASWLLNSTPSSIDGLARQIIAVASVGADTSPLVTKLLAARSAGQGAAPVWGAYPGYSMAMPDTALGLEALSAAGRAEAGNTIAMLTQLQMTDGGWAYGDSTKASFSDLIPTAEALRVAARYIIANPSAKTTDVDTSMGKAVTWLLARKKNDGGYADDANKSGVTDATKPGQVQESALVWNALTMAKQAGITAAGTTAATTALTNAENFVIAKQAADGSFGGDALQTASVLRMWANSGLLTDTDHDGVPDVAEAILNTNANVADARNLPKGNGNPVPPTLLNGAVAQADDSADTPTLPEWGAILMGSLLMLSMLRRHKQQS